MKLIQTNFAIISINVQDVVFCPSIKSSLLTLNRPKRSFRSIVYTSVVARKATNSCHDYWNPYFAQLQLNHLHHANCFVPSSCRACCSLPHCSLSLFSLARLFLRSAANLCCSRDSPSSSSLCKSFNFSSSILIKRRLLSTMMLSSSKSLSNLLDTAALSLSYSLEAASDDTSGDNSAMR